MTDHLRPTSIDHARHDPELVAALAAREPDLAAGDLATARDLVERCSGCRDLLADLLALQVALPVSSTPARPRGFTLSAADARKLTPRGWRAAIRFFGSARDSFSRPLAIGFTTIGVVALLITAAPSFQLGSGGATVLSTVGSPVEMAAPAEAPAGGAGAAPAASSAPMASAAASAAPPTAAPAPAAQQPTNGAAQARASASTPPRDSAAYGTVDRTATTAEPYGTAGEGPVFNGEDDGSSDELTTDTTASAAGVDRGPSLGLIVAGICLIVGFGLFALRWSSRRFGEG